MIIFTIISRAAKGVGCEPDIVAAVAAVESSSGRALRRFEPKVFQDLSGRLARSYAAAARINREMAEAACSHGVFQVMGYYYQALGYASAAKMAGALAKVEDVEAQARSFVDYCQRVAPAAGAALRARDIEGFSLAYNGAAALRRGYDVKLRAALAQAGGSGARILRYGARGAAVRRLQYLLLGAGADIAPDGFFGAKTKAAVEMFQGSAGLFVDGVVGAKTWAALEAVEEDRDEPPRSLAEKAVDALRVAPRRWAGLLATMAALAGNLGLTGAAAFLEALSRGDYGAAGAMALSVAPWVVAALCVALAAWIAVEAVRMWRRQRDAATILKEIRNDGSDQDRSGGPVFERKRSGRGPQIYRREGADDGAGARGGWDDSASPERRRAPYQPEMVDRRAGDGIDWRSL